MTHINPYTLGLDKNEANHVQLSPLTFLERTAFVYPEHIATIHGETRYTWSETYTRCRRLASALKKHGVQEGDTVAVMAPNVPAIFEAHFGVPMIGAVLNTLNTRLNAETIAFMLDHGDAKVLITDKEFSPVVSRALHMVARPPLIIDIDDPLGDGGELLGDMDYESFLNQGEADFSWTQPKDEWQAITLSYTSGTTGNPKGVVYHHRGAYLNAVSNIIGWNMPKHAVYLWTLPMFHCNGWCFPWTLAALAGTNICLRQVDPEQVYTVMAEEKVTHFCGAPIVHNMLINVSDEIRAKKTHTIEAFIAGAAPPAAILAGMEKNGFKLTHVYGLTETYGPSVLCEHQNGWEEKTQDERARLNARQGVRSHMLEGLMVADSDTLTPVPADGKTMGEVFMRGNNVMMGYLKNPHATEEAFEGGWFHSGDLAVIHPDGYIEVKDRSKDIIISGGENISTIEVEDVLYRHPAILEAAVVARPDEKWGETPCAFVTLKEGHESTTDKDIITFCREQIAHYKAPKTVVFGGLPKTSTGKIQKFVLREQAKALNEEETV